MQGIFIEKMVFNLLIKAYKELYIFYPEMYNEVFLTHYEINSFIFKFKVNINFLFKTKCSLNYPLPPNIQMKRG
jgi:hypothetical protein